jgi:hypothetical protein
MLKRNRVSRRAVVGAAFAFNATFLIALHAQAAPALGQKAPDFTAQDLSGKSVNLSDFKGKYVVLEWTNPGCPFVRKHYNGGNMPATQKDAVAKGAVWLSVNSTERESADWLSPQQLARWQAEKGAAPTATLLDEDGHIGRAYGARTTPHLYNVNPQGQLVYAGGIDSIPSARADDIARATNYVKQGLGEALAGKPISVASSQPYGCSIKYKS